MTASPWPSPARLRANEGASRIRRFYLVYPGLRSRLHIARLSGYGAKLGRYLFQVLRCPTTSRLPRLFDISITSAFAYSPSALQ